MSSLDPDLRLYLFVLYSVGIGIRTLSSTAKGQGECWLMKVTHSEKRVDVDNMEVNEPCTVVCC